MSQVLIIDDDSVICLFAETCLSAAGYEVLTALDGETGLRLAVERRPDVVVTDVMMPGIHGFGVVEAIRANPNLAGTKIVVCSMKSYATDIQQAKNAGADRFLAKPYTPEALQEVVAELISGVAPAPPAPKVGSMPPAAAKTGAFTRDQLGLTATSSSSAGARMRVKFWGTRGSIATPGP